MVTGPGLAVQPGSHGGTFLQWPSSEGGQGPAPMFCPRVSVTRRHAGSWEDATCYLV